MAGRSVVVTSAAARAARRDQLRSGWSFNLYPDACEGGGSWQPPRPSAVLRPGPNGAVDPERSAREAARRARSKVRRYVVANRCSKMWTLTYRGDGNHDRDLFVEHMQAFWRRLRAGLGRDFPYVWVPEWHPLGHGLHAHVGVSSFIPVALVRECWPHGDRIDCPKPVGARVGRSHGAQVDQARACARYLGKYVGKAFGDDRRPLGDHRYDVAEGFQPRVVNLSAPTLDEVVGLAVEQMGGEVPDRVWESAEDAEFRAIWLAWSA